MSDERLLKEIMDEVESLNQSIQEYCPEIISVSRYPSIQDMGDEMNVLIEHRIKFLTESSRMFQECEKQ